MTPEPPKHPDDRLEFADPFEEDETEEIPVDDFDIPRRGERRRDPEPSPDPEPEETDEAVGGVVFFLAAIVLSLVAVGWALFALRGIGNADLLDKIAYDFRNIDLMPGDNVALSAFDDNVRVYFTHDGRTLSPQVRRLPRRAGEMEKARLILDELFAPPSNPLYRSPLPEGAGVRGFYLLDRTACLDLTEDFLRPANPTPRRELLAVYAVVNSLTLNSEAIDAVQLFVGGRPIETPWGWVDCSTPLGPNLALIQ